MILCASKFPYCARKRKKRRWRQKRIEMKCLSHQLHCYQCVPHAYMWIHIAIYPLRANKYVQRIVWAQNCDTHNGIWRFVLKLKSHKRKERETTTRKKIVFFSVVLGKTQDENREKKESEWCVYDVLRKKIFTFNIYIRKAIEKTEQSLKHVRNCLLCHNGDK